MKAYKGFDKNLQCRGFQYEVGKTYTMPEGEDVKLCERGFHACIYIIDCFSYYAPAESRYCEVELEDVSSEIDTDSKRVARTITIVRELTLDEVHDISSEQQEKEIGGYGSSVSGGDESSVRGGDDSSVRGGYRSSVSGGYGSSVSGGSESSVRGGYGSSVRGGNTSRFKGSKNCVFAAEYYKDYIFVGMRVAIVDGMEFSTDKWYELDADGNWKEAENQQD